MNMIRGLVAVIGGLVVTGLLVQLLGITLANAVAQHPLNNPDEFAAVFNTPAMMVARLLYTGVAGILGGYVTARIAAHDPMRYTVITALFQAILLILGIVAGYAQPIPILTQIGLVLSSTLGILAGGSIRAAVATLPSNRHPD